MPFFVAFFAKRYKVCRLIAATSRNRNYMMHFCTVVNRNYHAMLVCNRKKYTAILTSKIVAVQNPQ